jgi:predicted ATP-dependent serine protease
LFLEVQALVGTSVYSNPRRVANGWDYNRLLQTIAVLEKKLGLSLASRDVYINVVGGLDFNHPSGDVGVSLAIATSLLDRSVPTNLVAIGEVGLTGELRQVSGADKILKEASRLGFKQIIIPKANLRTGSLSANGKETADKNKLKITSVGFLQEVFNEIIPNWQKDLQAIKRSNREPDSNKLAKTNN